MHTYTSIDTKRLSRFLPAKTTTKPTLGGLFCVCYLCLGIGQSSRKVRLAYFLMWSTLSFTQSGVRSWAICCWYMRMACTMSFRSLAGRTTGLLSSFMEVTMLLISLYFSVSSIAVSAEVAGRCFCSWSCME